MANVNSARFTRITSMNLVKEGLRNGAEDKLRVELTGSGMVVSFEFPEGADLATALTVAGERFERI